MEPLLKELQLKTEELRKKLRIRASNSRILSVLIDYPCLQRCLSELRPRSHELLDQYYLERHEFVRKLLVDLLLLRLREEGFQELLPKIENRGQYGCGDVDVEYNHMGLDIPANGFKIRIEIKGGVRFAVSQLLKYLLDANAVVLCRAGKGDAVTITRSDAKDLLTLMLKIVISKLDLLLNGNNNIRITGPWCHGCPSECPFRRAPVNHDVDLANEFAEAIKYWPKAIEEAVKQVIDLLKKIKKTQKLESVSNAEY